MHKKMRTFMIFIVATALLVSGCSSGTNTTEAAASTPVTEAFSTLAPKTEAPTTQAPTTQAPATEAPTTLAPTTEAAPVMTVSNDFDPATNVVHDVNGIEFQIPANWVEVETAFYADTNQDSVAVLNYLSMRGYTNAMMVKQEFITSYAGGLKTAFQQDAEVISAKLSEINGKDVILTKLRGVTNGHEMELHGATMMSPDDKYLVAFLFTQTLDGPVDYFGDFDMILENLRFIEPSSESGGATDVIVAHDFDPETNRTYEIGGIEYQVPAGWEGEPPVFYATKDPVNFTMFYYTLNEGIRYKTLHEPSNLSDFENSLKKSLGIEGDLARSEFVEIGGREVHWMTGSGVVESVGKEMEITFVTMASADGKDTIVFSYWAATSTEIDYSEDFEKIIENLKNVD